MKEVVILGAGVIGLTTALKIQEKGDYKVTILAEVLPTDPRTIKYTSQWAGAHHVNSSAKEGTLQHKMDTETFKIMWELSKQGGEAEGCFMRIPQTEYYESEYPKPSCLQGMPHFREVPNDKLIPGSTCGVSFDTVTIDVPKYLTYLFSRFLANGGKITRGSVQHISQILEGGSGIFSEERKSTPIDGIIVCAGLGARTLGGVEDSNVHALRGQTVILKAPWLKFGVTLSSKASWTYIIPRRSGDVVVGGTRDKDDWYPLPRLETTRDILTRGLILCPELAPPDARRDRQPTLEDVLPNVVMEGCGMRPMREGGIRLDFEIKENPKGKKIPVVYNYGHEGHGYIASFGSARVATELLLKAFEEISSGSSNKPQRVE